MKFLTSLFCSAFITLIGSVCLAQTISVETAAELAQRMCSGDVDIDFAAATGSPEFKDLKLETKNTGKTLKLSFKGALFGQMKEVSFEDYQTCLGTMTETLLGIKKNSKP